MDKTVRVTVSVPGSSSISSFTTSGKITKSQFVGTCVAPPTPACIPDSAISYTYSAALNSGSVTVAKVPGSTGVLCAPIYLTATSWAYTAKAVWPQELVAANKQTISTPGEYPYSALVACGQGDIYASRSGYVVPTDTLSGPQAWETFLSGLGLATSTPGSTYVQQPYDCYSAPKTAVRIPTDPSAFDQVCDANANDGTTVEGYIDVLVVTGVTYTIHNVADSTPANDITPTTSRTSVPPGTYRVTAAALPGFEIEPGVTWPDYTVAAASDCGQLDTHPLVTPSVTVGDETCTTGSARSGHIGIDTTDGLSYFVGGSQLVSAVTAFAPGTYTVTAVGDADNGIDGSPTRTVTISARDSSCGTVVSSELTTLAFTGVGGSTYLFAGAGALIILLGAAVLITARARRKADHS